MGLSALLTLSAAGLAVASSAQSQNSMAAGSLALAVVAAGISLREMGKPASKPASKPEHAALLLMVQALVLTKGIAHLSATSGL